MPDNNALHIAAKGGDLGQVQSQVGNFDINAKGEDGGTALYLSACNGFADIVELLLSFNPDVTISDLNDSSALIKASENGHPEAIKALLTAPDINVNQPNEKGYTALIKASENGHSEAIKALLTAPGIDVNLVSMYGLTALMKASDKGHAEAIKLLLTAPDIDVNRAVELNGYTALICASACGHTEAIKALLIAPDINVNHANTHGSTALMVASVSGHAEAIEALLTAPGIDVNHVDTGGYTALTNASSNRHPRAIKALLTVPDIDVNHATEKGYTALMFASRGGHPEVIKALLTAPNIDVNHANNDCWTSMHFLAQRGKVDVFVAMLNLGAHYTIKNKQGMTCFDLLSAKDKPKVLTALDLNLSLLEAHDYLIWFVIVQVIETADVDLFAKLLAMVEALLSSHPTLAVAKDADGRAAVDVASKPMKLIMQSVLLWHGRYRVTESRPEHISATCFVFKAVDEHTIDKETGQPIKVALKLMRLKDQFQREISTRDKRFNNQMVMNVLQQMRPNPLHKVTSQVDNGGVYRPSQAGVYFKSSYRCVDHALVETVCRLRSEDPTTIVPHYRCSKHEHELSLNPTDNKRICDVCHAVSPRYTCCQCGFDICEICFNKEDDHQEFPAESTTWLLTMQEGKDQPETELARSEEPTLRASAAVFSNIKVEDGEDGTVIVFDLQAAATATVTPDVRQDNGPDEVVDVEADATGQLTKSNAEKFYLLVMPLADRNLFVALKQERWAGKNMEEVRHVFVQLVHCVEHMHEKGVLHADLKTLNIVRTAGQWKLIDLDAACEIGKEPVGHKSSSAYVPPEAIYVDEKTDFACVRSVVAVTKGEASYELLTAHPSFDVWSLGCILFQMCTADVKPLLQGGQDDNLVGVRKGVDNLFALSEWSPELKADKLADVPDKLARNLLSQMLHKDPLHRPSLARVLAHSFLSGKKVARLVGEKPKYDVFLSYRVASDSQHVEKLYNLLTGQGFKVYWDKLCLEPGVDWEQGFCEGLVSSRAFVPLLSPDAINHPDKDWQNFSKLTTDSKCDNVFLEHRLAVELQGLGLIEKMFPVFIGNLDATTSEYSHYFGGGCNPSLSEITVNSVEEKLRHHMESQALGTPIVPDRTIASVVGAITACQGAFIVGPADATFDAAAASIAKMLTDVPIAQSPRGGTHIHQALLDTMDNKTLVAEVTALKREIATMKSENGTLIGKIDSLEGENGVLIGKVDNLVGQRATALTSLRNGEFASVEAVIAHMEALLQG